MGARRGAGTGRWLGAAVLLAMALVANPAVRAAGPGGASSQFGIDFISAPGSSYPNQDQRYAAAQETGAAWNRWVIYWSSVETSCDQSYDWSGVDPVVAADAAQGLSDDAVLLGTPACYASSYRPSSLPRSAASLAPHGGIRTQASSATTPPSGLAQPTFADGTDTWWPGKPINSANPWARFVYAAVSRYHLQIHDWEIWNEPDYSAFWSGSIGDYARLLKVAYLAARAADPSARILVGGMMYWEWTNAYNTDQAWLKQFLPLLASDPAAPANGFYFDVIPWHWYSRSLDVYTHLRSAQSVLASYGLGDKELWVNETNVPACDDAGPDVTYVACSASGPPGYANDVEQASFIVQSVAYAFAAGATRVFEFQQQDDGNGQAFGMFRNDGTQRPIYTAYQLAAQYLSGFAVAQRSVANGTEALTFGVPGGQPHRVTVLWDDAGNPATAVVPAAGVPPTGVSLVRQDGYAQSLAPAPSYAIQLPGATDARNFDQPWNPNDFTVGGQTWLLVENLPPDATPPTSKLAAAPVSSSSISLRWAGGDPNGWGVADYTIQYRDLATGGPWQTYLANTTTTSATFAADAGHAYQFRSLARDWAGNVEIKPCFDTSVTAPTAATVRAAAQQTYRTYFPLVGGPPLAACS